MRIVIFSLCAFSLIVSPFRSLQTELDIAFQEERQVEQHEESEEQEKEVGAASEEAASKARREKAFKWSMVAILAAGAITAVVLTSKNS